MFVCKQVVLVERCIWEMLCVCCVKKVLRPRHFFFNHAKSSQRTIACSKRSARSESKVATPRETIEALEKWRRKFNIEGVGHRELFKREKVTKHPSFYYSPRRGVEAILIFETRLKSPRYWFPCNWFEWKLRSACRQFVRFCYDFHVFFEVGYLFHFIKYCWSRRRKIRSTSYSWFFCDW